MQACGPFAVAPGALMMAEKQTAVYRSKDGGETWEKIMKGLARYAHGTHPVTCRGSKSTRTSVYLITEYPKAYGHALTGPMTAAIPGRMVNKDPNINFRPFYYSDIRVDPNNAGRDPLFAFRKVGINPRMAGKTLRPDRPRLFTVTTNRSGSIRHEFKAPGVEWQ